MVVERERVDLAASRNADAVALFRSFVALAREVRGATNIPIMHAARALAQTLTGKRTPVTFPAMPVLVKTPACPTVVAPPPVGAAGQWQIEAHADGVKSLFVAADGRLLGFALNGAATAERARLAPQLPPVLA